MPVDLSDLEDANPAAPSGGIDLSDLEDAEGPRTPETDKALAGTTWGQKIATGLATGVRIAGGLATAPAELLDVIPGPGWAARAGIGAVIGGGTDLAAQAIEKAAGLRKAYSPQEAGVSAALQTVPLGEFANIGRAARVGVRALQGAGLSAAGTQATSLLETGQPASLGQTGQAAAIGGVFGAGGQLVFDRLGRAHVVPAATRPGTELAVVPPWMQRTAGPVPYPIASPVSPYRRITPFTGETWRPPLSETQRIATTEGLLTPPVSPPQQEQERRVLASANVGAFGASGEAGRLDEIRRAVAAGGRPQSYWEGDQWDRWWQLQNVLTGEQREPIGKLIRQPLKTAAEIAAQPQPTEVTPHAIQPSDAQVQARATTLRFQERPESYRQEASYRYNALREAQRAAARRAVPSEPVPAPGPVAAPAPARAYGAEEPLPQVRKGPGGRILVAEQPRALTVAPERLGTTHDALNSTYGNIMDPVSAYPHAIQRGLANVARDPSLGISARNKAMSGQPLSDDEAAHLWAHHARAHHEAVRAEDQWQKNPTPENRQAWEERYAAQKPLADLVRQVDKVGGRRRYGHEMKDETAIDYGSVTGQREFIRQRTGMEMPEEDLDAARKRAMDYHEMREKEKAAWRAAQPKDPLRMNKDLYDEAVNNLYKITPCK